MKVIMLEDVKGKGKKGEVKDLPTGFAGFLIKNKKAVEATQGNMNMLKRQAEDEKKQEALRLEEAKSLKTVLEGKTAVVSVKSGNNGRVFGSISSKAIAEAFEQQFSIKLDKRKMDLEEPIRGLGMARVPIHLHPEVTATLSIQIKEK